MRRSVNFSLTTNEPINFVCTRQLQTFDADMTSISGDNRNAGHFNNPPGFPGQTNPMIIDSVGTAGCFSLSVIKTVTQLALVFLANAFNSGLPAAIKLLRS